MPAPAFAPGSASRLALVALACACGAAAFAQPPAAAPDAAANPKAAAAPSGLHLTREQLAGIRLHEVAMAEFRDEALTDGKIAWNGDRTTPVYSPFSGRVVALHAAVGDAVRAGDPLLSIESPEFLQAQSDLIAARSALATAQAQFANASSIEERRRALLEAGAASRQDAEQARADLEAARGTRDAAQASFAAARDRLLLVGRTPAQLDELLASGHVQARAALLAPVDGMVADRQAGPGQYLQAGSGNPVFLVGDASSLWILAWLREDDAPWVHVGDEVEARVHALPGRSFRARITHVAPSIDPASRRLAVRAEVANRDGMLKPEMFAGLRVRGRAGARAPAVPESAVLYDGAQAHVWVSAPDGSLALRRLRLGRTSEGMLEVLEGLRAGEKVVSGGAIFIDRAMQPE